MNDPTEPCLLQADAAESKNGGQSLREDEPPLREDERQACEVWTRVMGYHRPVASFNTGKKGEHAERRFFAENRCGLGA